MTRSKLILILVLLILLGAGLLAYGALSRGEESRHKPLTEAEKLAEMEAALIEAAAAGTAKPADCEIPERQPTRRPSRTRST